MKKALAVYPEFALAWNELGIENTQLGRYEQAGEALRAAIKLAPDALIPRLNYGFVLLQQKNYAPAESECSTRAKRWPSRIFIVAAL